MPMHCSTAGRTPRRTIITLTAAAIAAVAAVLAPPAMACACGGMVLPAGADSSVDREVALITADGTREVIHMQLSVDADTDDLGLLVPLPAPAELSLGDPQLFDDLSTAIRPRPREEFHLFGPPVLFGSADETSGGAPAGAGGGVQVIGEVDLGPLQAATLSADDPAALQNWLDENGYEMADGLAAQLQPYIDEDWTFVAARLTQEGKDLQGDLPPLVMEFPSTGMVYPMRMSRAAEQTQTVLTYVLDDHRMERTDATAAGTELLFAGIVAADAMQSEQLGQVITTTPYLTAMEQVFSDPAEQIVSDLSFGQAPDDTGFQRTYTVDTYGIPIDVAIIGLVVVLALGGLLIWFLVKRRGAQREDSSFHS